MADDIPTCADMVRVTATSVCILSVTVWKIPSLLKKKWIDTEERRVYQKLEKTMNVRY